VLRILLVKTSSLGDVISNLPVASDILRADPQAQIDWVVEAPFAAVVRLHPGVGRVIPVAIRRWRKTLCRPATWREIRALYATLGETQYDYVIDTQGLLKSAWLMTIARGQKCGYDRASIREPWACLAYDRRFKVSWAEQAVWRNRALAAQVLGYPIERETPPDYGLGHGPGLAEFDWMKGAYRYAVLLTNTSRADKLWPAAYWVELGRRLAERGLLSILPAGSAAERAATEKIAARIEGAILAPPLDLTALAVLIKGAVAVVGLDTGLTHLAAALEKPVVGLYIGSNPAANGVIGAHAACLGAPGAPPAPEAVLAALRDWI
jgi:heptosyltransferase-1